MDKPRGGKTEGFFARGGPWVVGQFALFAFVIVAPRLAPKVLLWSGVAHRIVGGVLALLGLELLAVGALNLGSSLTPLPKPANGSALRTNGVFRYVRHPVYCGFILLAFGYCAWCPSALDLVAAVVALVFFTRKAIFEERLLCAQFPEYSAYMGRTWRFIPFVY